MRTTTLGAATWPRRPSGIAHLAAPGHAPLPVRFLPTRLGASVLLLLGLIVSYLLGSGDHLVSMEELNVLGPIALLVICLVSAVDLVRKNTLMIFSPLFWLFSISAVYYGFGPLLYRYGNPVSVAYLQEYYSLDPETLYKTNLLNATGVLGIALTYAVGIRLFPLRAVSGPPVFDGRRTDRFILICLLIGSPIRYVLVPLNNSGALGFYLPAQVLEFHFLTVFALMLMVRMQFLGTRRWTKVLVPLLAWEMLLRFSGGGKLDVFLLLLPIFLGIYLARPSPKLFIQGALMAILIWPVLARVSDAVRLRSWYEGEPSGLSERLSATLAAFNSDSPRYGVSHDGTVQRSWTRLCYAPAQGFCLNAYDEGRPGDTFAMWYWAFVPRVLFPAKPEMTVGQMFNVLVTGNPDSKSTPGAFAEAYWNGGWLAVLGVCTLLGALFLFVTHVATGVFLRSDYRWLPFVWSGIVSGIGISGFFVPTYVGSWPIALSTCLLLWFLFPTSPSGRQRRQVESGFNEAAAS